MYDIKKHESEAVISLEDSDIWIKGKFLSQSVMDKFTKKHSDGTMKDFYLDVMVDRLSGWGGIGFDGKELEFSKESCDTILEEAPDLAQWIMGSLRSHTNFVLDLEDFKKKLRTLPDTLSNGKSPAGNQPIAENA